MSHLWTLKFLPKQMEMLYILLCSYKADTSVYKYPINSIRNTFQIPTIQLLYCNLLVVLTVVVRTIVSLEEPSPEIFLQPRNFNPHPYEVIAQKEERNGPVLFPANPDDNLVENRSNFVTARNFPLRDIQPVDNHPYVKVARKQKYRVRGRFHEEVRFIYLNN